ncbi:MAG TPA: DUF2911 domain-containing protein [Chitinophagaceae bacterium]|nr:DUF2911 domain-containing protein [Chitinophagaceae bacterium]
MKPASRSCFVILIIVICFGCNSRSGKKEISPAKNNGNADSIMIAQQELLANPYSPVDVSPMDMSYYPADYPKMKMAHAVSAPPVIRVVYSRPHLGGRHLFHEVLKYGEPWRLGANESTEMQFFRDVSIQNKKIKAGRYMIYCIPQASKWIIALNSNIDSWGLKIDSTLDIARFEIPVKEVQHPLEYFTMIFEKDDHGASLLMAWENLEARLPIEF